jgi:hypothetical protein
MRSGLGYIRICDPGYSLDSNANLPMRSAVNFWTMRQPTRMSRQDHILAIRRRRGFNIIDRYIETRLSEPKRQRGAKLFGPPVMQGHAETNAIAVNLSEWVYTRSSICGESQAKTG